MNKATAQKAAKWWADQLRGNAKLDNGDRETGGMASLFGIMLQQAEKTKQSTEQVDAFEKSLADVLLKEQPRWGFGVDYHPDAILEAAAQSASLNLGMCTLPWKTTMFIDGEKVTVRCGYGAEPEVL